ncbi:glycoside hydrolase family 5 protein [Arenimonas sp. MALMAid1274]|uniref:glycoside hydrolase family 5 protein n=1 Tax=Arenimonas sp. MALMAid1274 TaxID=3411630 RepID=UPI003BA147E8
MNRLLPSLTHGLLAVLLLLAAPAAYAQAEAPVIADPAVYPNIGRFDARQLAREQDVIRIQGNRFIDEAGKTFTFRGVSIADPDKLATEGQWKQSLFQEVKDWGANTIRLPVHPRAWRSRGQAEYFRLLDQAVVWANALDLYLIIDWHSIGALASGNYQHPMYVTDRQETLRFWHDIAFRYQDVPTTALYELFNEPTTLKDPWGEREWDQWKALNEQIIDVIRAVDDDAIAVVAGFDWAYDLTPLRRAPVDRAGIAYACHPYPQKEQPDPATEERYFALWEEKWGFASKTYPLVCTELGWVQPGGYGAHVPVKDDGRYGPRIVEFMESRGISWTAWAFDPQWSPTLINNWNFEPSEQGAFFKRVMQQKAAAPE